MHIIFIFPIDSLLESVSSVCCLTCSKRINLASKRPKIALPMKTLNSRVFPTCTNTKTGSGGHYAVSFRVNFTIYDGERLDATEVSGEYRRSAECGEDWRRAAAGAEAECRTGDRGSAAARAESPRGTPLISTVSYTTLRQPLSVCDRIFMIRPLMPVSVVGVCVIMFWRLLLISSKPDQRH